MTKIYHQVRLNVLPLNEWLNNIKKAKTPKCIFDGEIETLTHFIKDCKEYDYIWKNLYYHRQRRIKNCVSILDLDRPPDFKKSVCVNIIKSLGKRKSGQTKLDNNKKMKK